MGKQILLKNILIELSQLPEAQLQRWYELIQKSGEGLPEQATPATLEADFDWDGFVEEVMKNREENNRQRLERLETIING